MKPHINVTKDRNREVIKKAKKKQEKPWILERLVPGKSDWERTFLIMQYITVDQALKEMNKLNRSVFIASDSDRKPINIYFKPNMSYRLYNSQTKEVVLLDYINNEITIKNEQ